MGTAETQAVRPSAIEPLLLEVADVVNTTLDLDTSLQRVAELVRRVIDYEIFAILLLNEKTQELRIRFQIGHPKDVAERMRVKVGEGVTGRAAQRGEAVLVNDVRLEPEYINAIPRVRSERFNGLPAPPPADERQTRPDQRSSCAARHHCL